MLDKAKALEEAKQSKSLTRGTSAFVTGAKFTVTGYDYEEFSNHMYPVFKTSLGSLSVKSLLKAKAVKPYTDPKTGELVTTRRPEGTFHDLIRDILSDPNNRDKSNDEILPILVEACKDKTFTVRLREYVTVENQYGSAPAALTHIDIIE